MSTPAHPFGLAGRRALVTGAGGGIGAEIAAALGAAGAAVAVHCNGNLDGARATVARIAAAGGSGATVQADLTDGAAAARTVATAAAELGGDLDIVVNNAGGILERRPVEQLDDELWHRVLAVNLHSAFVVSRSAIPMLRASAAGRIVNVSSLASLIGGGGGPPRRGGTGTGGYATAKSALDGLTRALARELAESGITVNSVAPGYIGDTALHGTLTDADTRRGILASIPVGRAGQVGDVAAAVTFLASDGAGFVTGETIVVDGGMRIG